jgi:hypothetical protein
MMYFVCVMMTMANEASMMFLKTMTVVYKISNGTCSFMYVDYKNSIAAG